MMKVGDKVEKISGYKYPGIVVAKFTKLDPAATGAVQERFVVECTEPTVSGMLHIFREGQLKKVEKEKSARKWWSWNEDEDQNKYWKYFF